MTPVILQTALQAIASTLHWLGFSFGARSLPGSDGRRRAWIFGAAILALAWLLAALLLAANDYFRNDLLPPRVPLALALSLMFGYALLLSRDFRTILAAIPQHWLIGVQAFRILGFVFLIRWAQGDLPGLFAIPAGIGDLLTGLCAPFVAYSWYKGKSNARSAAIAWSLFGMADLIVAVAIGSSISGLNIAFPMVMIPIYAVPRAFLLHSYSLIGLLGAGAKQPTLVRAAELARERQSRAPMILP
jgi:hypothetical protein